MNPEITEMIALLETQRKQIEAYKELIKDILSQRDKAIACAEELVALIEKKR